MSFLYKSSFDKANRSFGASFRGAGMAEGRESVGVSELSGRDCPDLRRGLEDLGITERVQFSDEVTACDCMEK